MDFLSPFVPIGWRLLNKLFERMPHYVNVNLVLHKKEDKEWDHIRVINLAPVSITMTYVIFLSKSEQTKIPGLYHQSTSTDPRGIESINWIPFTEEGIFLYSKGLYYFPVDGMEFNIPDNPQNGEIQVEFKFKTLDGKDSSSITKNVVICRSFKSVEAAFKDVNNRK